MAQYFSPKISTSGLSLVLDAGNTKSYPGSGTRWTDLSGNGNHGTLVGSPTYSTSNGGIFTLNGSTQYIDCGNGSSLNVTSTFTLQTFLRTTFTNATNTIFSKDGAGVDTTGAYNFYFFSTGGLNYESNNNIPDLSSSTGLFASNSWTSLSLTFDNSASTKCIMYVNGVAVASGNPAVPSSTSTNLLIGRRGGPGLLLQGDIAMASIYNRALSADEVLQNFNATRGRFGV
jgi:hypothetical protein